MAAQRHRSGILRAVAVIGIALAFLVSGGTGASASAPSAEDVATARYLQFTAPMAEFVDARGAGLADPKSPFDWGSDGCTTPNIKDLAFWNATFEQPCWRHDFGYSNFGKGGYVQDATEPTRQAIDDKFKADMYGVCRPMPIVKRLQCQVVASTYYNVVRNVGKIAFYS